MTSGVGDDWYGAGRNARLEISKMKKIGRKMRDEVDEVWGWNLVVVLELRKAIKQGSLLSRTNMYRIASCSCDLHMHESQHDPHSHLNLSNSLVSQISLAPK